MESLRMQYKKKAIKMLFLVMVIFISCWMPLLTFDLLSKLFHWPLEQGMVTLRYYLQVCPTFLDHLFHPAVGAALVD